MVMVDLHRCIILSNIPLVRSYTGQLCSVELASATTSISEPDSFCPSPVPSPVFEPEHKSKIVASPLHISKVGVFPYLNMEKMTKQEKESLQCKLLRDTDDLMFEFSDVIHYTIISLNANHDVSVKILSSRLASLGAYKPIHAQKPLLRDDLEKIGSCETIDEMFFILRKYYSFFNYGIIQQIIIWFGKPADLKRLQEYTIHFNKFCERRTFECPPDIFGHPNGDKNIIVVKTEDSWDPREETQGKPLVQVLKLKISFAKILGVEPETLYLCRIDKGCMELLFQVPSFVEEDVFPLSVEQENSLVSIGVARLTSGSGICMFSVKVYSHFLSEYSLVLHVPQF